MKGKGASQYWGGNSLAGNRCQRRRNSFTGSWREAGQAGGRGESAAVLSAGDRRDVVWLDTFDWGPSTNFDHQVGEGCFGRGGVAGAEPPHKGGPNRPDRPELQWLVVSGQRGRSGCLTCDRGVAKVWSPPEVYDCVPRLACAMAIGAGGLMRLSLCGDGQSVLHRSGSDRSKNPVRALSAALGGLLSGSCNGTQTGD